MTVLNHSSPAASAFLCNSCVNRIFASLESPYDDQAPYDFSPFKLSTSRPWEAKLKASEDTLMTLAPLRERSG